MPKQRERKKKMLLLLHPGSSIGSYQVLLLGKEEQPQAPGSTIPLTHTLDEGIFRLQSYCMLSVPTWTVLRFFEHRLDDQVLSKAINGPWQGDQPKKYWFNQIYFDGVRLRIRTLGNLQYLSLKVIIEGIFSICHYWNVKLHHLIPVSWKQQRKWTISFDQLLSESQHDKYNNEWNTNNPAVMIRALI